MGHAPPLGRSCASEHRPTVGSYTGTSLMRNRAPLVPYSRTMARALRWP